MKNKTFPAILPLLLLFLLLMLSACRSVPESSDDPQSSAPVPSGPVSTAVQAALPTDTDFSAASEPIALGSIRALTSVLPSISHAALRTFYAEGFYYEPLSDAIINRITGISYPASETYALEATVSETHPQEAAASPDGKVMVNVLPDAEAAQLVISYEDLRYLTLLYYDFDHQVQTGELICHQALAEDMIEIFYELYLQEYEIESVKLIDEFDGDDTASMAANNTSCFNYRVVDGTDHLSRHALGCAIDINPFYNPYVVFGRGENGGDYISPPGSKSYADRSLSFPHKIDENDLCYQLFTSHGFQWGGDWHSVKDYQHFQKVIE